MSRRARWIRLACTAPDVLGQAAAAFAAMQVRGGAPIVLWSSARGDCRDHREPAATPFGYGVLAPAHAAPGRQTRWASWALAPAAAVYRDLGLRAYLNDDGIFAQGRRIAAVRTQAIAGWAVITATLGAHPAAGILEPGGAQSATFRAWLREGLGLAMSQFADRDRLPAERAFEADLRARMEAQHDWQFESAWPTSLERASLEEARGHQEPVEPRALSEL